jgi:trehalose 6-phosphate synthase
LIVRVDRTDPSKNIVRGFHAFELLLERHSEWHGRVSMLARLDPSRERIPEYVAYREEIERAVKALNERFGDAGWQPVDLRIEDDFALSVAAYKQYDVLLVNAVYDGLNLVAKEGPLVNTRDGVLVLSENAGAYEELGEWVLAVNPFDIVGQADALHEALSMDAGERRRRADGLRAHVRENDVARWLQGLLDDVDAVSA